MERREGGDWVQLFNGKDLTGWKTLPGRPGNWRVDEHGILVGTGPGSHLFSERGDYENFHLRVEAKINADANGGVWFRSGFALPRKLENGLDVPDGYEADILTIKDGWKTGSLTRLQAFLTELIKPGEWFTLEVIADGHHLATFVNGWPAASYEDRPSRYAKGHIILQALFDKSVLQVRKVEIGELTPR